MEVCRLELALLVDVQKKTIYPTHKTRDEPPFVDTGYSGDIEKDMIGCNGIYEGPP